MQCSITKLIALILATIVIIVGAMAAANWGGPPGWLVAGGAILGALAMLVWIDAAFREYATCRDSAQGVSSCGSTSITNLLTAINVALGIAASAFFSSAAIFWNIFAGGPAAAAVALLAGLVACGVAIALLLALLATVYSYKGCRDTPAPTPPLGTGAGPLTNTRG